MMSFSEFKEYIEAHYLEYLPEEYSKGKIVFQKMKKNNGIILEGVSIRRSDTGGAPLQYLEQYYAEYCKGNFLGNILSDMAHEYVEFDKNAQENIGNLSIMEINDFSKQRDKVTFRVINQKQNKALLNDMPNILIADLAKVYSIDVNENAAIRIDNRMLKAWGINLEDLDKAATENTMRLHPSDFFPLSEEIYVLTNNKKNMGAATMFYPDLLDDIAKKLNKPFYIIPSSVHELILIVDTGEMNKREVKGIVEEANKSIISKEDFLSNNIYEYDKEYRKIRMIPVKEPRGKGFER